MYKIVKVENYWCCCCGEELEREVAEAGDAEEEAEAVEAI